MTAKRVEAFPGEPTLRIEEKVRRAGIAWANARDAEREARSDLTKAIQDARQSGMTLSRIAEALGLSRQRVEQLSK